MEPRGLPWLHGFAALIRHYLTQQSFMKQNNPYGSTLKCTQGYGAEGPSVAPWVRCVDLALFDSIRETKKLFGLTIKCTQGYEAAGSSMRSLR